MPNLNHNRINIQLSEADITLIKTHLEAINSIIPEVGLTAAERKSMRGIQNEKRIFAQDCIMALKENGSEVMPPYINVDAIINDFGLNQQLSELEQQLESTLSRIADARRLTGHETLNSIYTVYDHYEIASNSGIPGSRTVYEGLKKHFDKNTGRKRSK